MEPEDEIRDLCRRLDPESPDQSVVREVIIAAGSLGVRQLPDQVWATFVRPGSPSRARVTVTDGPFAEVSVAGTGPVRADGNVLAESTDDAWFRRRSPYAGAGMFPTAHTVLRISSFWRSTNRRAALARAVSGGRLEQAGRLLSQLTGASDPLWVRFGREWRVADGPAPPAGIFGPFRLADFEQHRDWLKLRVPVIPSRSPNRTLGDVSGGRWYLQRHDDRVFDVEEFAGRGFDFVHVSTRPPEPVR